MPAEHLRVGGARLVVLVEGASDRAAVHALAAREDRDLTGEGIVVLAMGGATNIGHYVRRLGPAGQRRLLAGLCDEGETRFFTRALTEAGPGTVETVADLARQRFFVCSRDLEEELIRALGTERVLALLSKHRDLSPYETFCRQPTQRGRPEADRLHRFLGTHSGRKIAYGSRLVAALERDRVPAPLAGLLSAIKLS